MIRAIAIDKETVHVEISSHDFRIVQHEAGALKASIPCRDRYWDPKLGVWVIKNPELYTNLWFIDHALRLIMKQMELA